MQRLIINADDLGCNPQRSHGIFQCMEFGIVTNATIWPNGSDSDASAKHAKERDIPVGLHLNLVEEYPLSKPDDVSSLISSNGQFYPHEKLWGLLEDGSIQKQHLEREVRAQLEWMFDQGLVPTHVASNYDMHVHPLITEVLIPLMERYGIRFVRIPCEEPLPPFGYEISAAQLRDVQRMNEKASAVRAIYEVHDIQSTNGFRGLCLLGNASLKNLRHTLNRLPEGTTELMVHPSSDITYGSNFDLDPQRQTELRMLLDETIPSLLKEKKIELCSFNDL